jgi:hypothetical protein
MRLILAAILTIASVSSTCALTYGDYTTAEELYDYIVENIYPAMEEKQCFPLMRTLLQRLETSEPKVPAGFTWGKWDDWDLRRELYEAHCVGRNFRIWPTPPPRGKSNCELGTLTRGSGILQLQILREDDRNDPTDECAYIGGILNNIAERVRWGDLKISAREPFILDLQGNHGGRVDLVLNKFFSPHDYAYLYTRKFRVKGLETDEKMLSTSTGVFPCPRVILVDNKTASGGEIIAEVVRLKCHDTPVMGKLTYGKGAGTGSYRLGKFTVRVPEDLYYFGGDQHTIDGHGVVPDILLSETTPEERLEAALNYVQCNASGAFRHR